MLEKIKLWAAAHPRWALTLLTVVALAPFLAKPFNLDEPLFVWSAQHIQAHPENPYDFFVNWYGVEQPMWAVTENPPLNCYFLALAENFFGVNEIGLHFVFLLPAIASILGTFRLAKFFCRAPLFAALTTLFCPAFFISSASVMCDVPLLALWIWAIVFWIEGLKENNFWKLFFAALLVSATFLTKYFGACLIPLLAVFGLLEKRKIGIWAAFLAIPLALICAYELWTIHLYHRALFSEATQYVKFSESFYGVSKMLTALNVLTFAGGSFAIVLFCAPFLWRKKIFFSLTAISILFATAIFSVGLIAKNYSALVGGARLSAEIQIIFWTIGGVFVLALAVADIWQRRDADAWLLALWIFGTFIFAGFVNWTVNVRSLLPMTPAVAILLARRVEKINFNFPRAIKFSLVASAATSFLAAQADFSAAANSRRAADEICLNYANRAAKIFFQGHWGFQFYMQLFGGTPQDFAHADLPAGDVLVLPSQNTNLTPPDPQKTILLETFSSAPSQWLATENREIGAGFYTSLAGPLPFAFGVVPPEKIFIFAAK